MEIREKLSILEKDWNEASLEIILGSMVIEECAILSTCNRFEVYYTTSSPRRALSDVMDYLSKRSGIDRLQLREDLFCLRGGDAGWHLMRVAGG